MIVNVAVTERVRDCQRTKRLAGANGDSHSPWCYTDVQQGPSCQLKVLREYPIRLVPDEEA